MTLERVTLSVVGPTSVHPDADLTATIPVRFPSYAVVLNAAWFLVWAAGETILILLLGSTVPEEGRGAWPLYRLALALALAAFTAAGLFLAWRLLWEALGREVLRMHDDELVLRREALGIGHSHTFPMWSVRDFRVGRFNEDPIYPLWSRLFVGKGPCYVSFRAGPREIHFGRGMSESDATYLVDRMKEGRREGARV
jgi:hypothetical protein